MLAACGGGDPSGQPEAAALVATSAASSDAAAVASDGAPQMTALAAAGADGAPLTPAAAALGPIQGGGAPIEISTATSATPTQSPGGSAGADPAKPAGRGSAGAAAGPDIRSACSVVPGLSGTGSVCAMLNGSPAAPARTYYVATGGSDVSSGTAQKPFASLQRAIDLAWAGDAIVVRAGTYNIYQPIRITDKAASLAAPITIRGETGATLKSVGEGAPGIWRGIIEIDRSSFVTVSNVAVANSSFFGFRVARSHGITLDGNRSAVSLGSAIHVSDSSDVIVSNNDVSRFCDRNQFGADGRTGCQEGITLSGVNGFVIHGNKVHDAPQSVGVGPGGGEGIDVKQGTKNGVIAFNSVWNLVQLGIYVDAYSAGASNIAVYGNRVWRTYMGIVVSSEAGGTASDIRIHDNIVTDVGVDAILVSNFKSNSSGNGPRQRIRIFNNTIANAGIKEAKPPFYARWTIGPFPDGGSGINIATTNVSGLEIFDNIVYGSKTSPIRVQAGLRAAARVQANLQWPAPGRRTTDEYAGSGALFLDPGFVSAAGSDWHLTAGSPAIGKGSGSGLASQADADGMIRPPNLADLGALIYRR